MLEQVRREKAVTITEPGGPVAVLEPLRRRRTRREPVWDPVGAGIWRNRKDMRDPVA